MAEILVLANETIGGEKLLDAIRERHAQGDARFHVVVPLTRPRHGNVIYDEAVRDSRAGARRPGARVHARGGHRRRRRGRRRRPAQRRAWTRSPSTGSTRSSSRRCPAPVLGLDEARPDRARSRRDRAAGQPRRRRPRARGPAVRRDARGREPDRRRAASSSSRLEELAERGPAPLHHRRAAGRRRRPRGRRPRASGCEKLLASLERGRDRRRRHDRRPRSLHGDDERRPVLPHLRDRDLDAARRTARSGWPTSSSTACTTRPNKPVEHVESADAAGGGLMEAGAPSRPAHATSTSTTARRRPTAPRAWTRRCSGCCFSSSPR